MSGGEFETDSATLGSQIQHSDLVRGATARGLKLDDLMNLGR